MATRESRRIAEQAFRDRRRATLGASDAAPSLGLSRFKTPLELYREKVGESEGQPETIPMRLGKELEDYVLELFEDETGLTVDGRQLVITDPVHKWRTATQDGWCADEAAQVEAKTTSAEQAWGDGPHDVPNDVMLQVQHQMACNPQARLAFVPVLFLVSKRFHYYEIERNERMIELLTEREREFWRYVETLTPPPPTTESDVRALFPQDNSETIIAPDAVRNDVMLLAKLQADIKDLKTNADAAKDRVLRYMCAAANLKDESGRLLATYRTTKPVTRLDGKALKVDKPDLYKQYSSVLPGSRRFLLKVK